MTHAAPTRLRRLARGLLGAALLCAGSSGLVLAATTPSQAAVAGSPYLFAASGYGTRITSGQLGLASAPTAYSVIGCGKYTGISRGNAVDATDLNGQVRVGAVTTSQRTFTLADGDSVGRSVTTVASVQVGTNALGLRITGLRGVSEVRATRAGKLSASYDFTFTDISPLGTTSLPFPLNQPADLVLQQLASGGPVTIPGLGTLALGTGGRSVSTAAARATGVGLRLHLFGQDQTAGTPDDSDVTLARSYAFVSRAAVHGVVAGGAWGVDAKALGVTAIGRNPYTALPCPGTRGQVVTRSLAGLNLLNLNQLDLGAMRNRVYGRQGLPTGGLTAWDESTVASLDLGGGQLRITGIRAVARIVRTSANRYLPSSSQTIGSITANGTPQTIPSPGQTLEIPGVARIEVPRPVRSVNGVSVTALRITLLGGTAANTVVNLGNAQAYARLR